MLLKRVPQGQTESEGFKIEVGFEGSYSRSLRCIPLTVELVAVEWVSF